MKFGKPHLRNELDRVFLKQTEDAVMHVAEANVSYAEKKIIFECANILRNVLGSPINTDDHIPLSLAHSFASI